MVHFMRQYAIHRPVTLGNTVTWLGELHCTHVCMYGVLYVCPFLLWLPPKSFTAVINVCV